MKIGNSQNGPFALALAGLVATSHSPAMGFADGWKAEPKGHLKNALGSRDGEYKFRSVEGVLIAKSSSVRCDTVCDKIADYDSFFDVARLKGGGFAALKEDAGGTYSWKVGETLRDVTSVRKLLVASVSPRRNPDMAGYELKLTTRLMDSEDLFVGVWALTNEGSGNRVIGLFSDDVSQRIEGLNVQGICRLATVDAPIIAVASEPSLHGEMWPVVIIVKRPKAANAQLVSFSLFPNSLQCNGKLKAAGPAL